MKITFQIEKLPWRTPVHETIVLDQDIIKIGTLHSSHLRINDPDASRMHAVIEVIGQEVWIVDLGSLSGTIVDSRKINRCLLKNGDHIRVGRTLIVVSF